MTVTEPGLDTRAATEDVSPVAGGAAGELAETVRLGEDRRSGSLPSLGFVWAGVLLAPGTIITGMVAAGGSAGPGFVFGFLGLALGTVLGSISVGVLSIWGPRTGLAQMPMGRLAFGAANVVPQVFLIFSLVAYDSLNDVFGVNALANAIGIPFALALAGVVSVEVVVVLFGIELMRRFGVVISAAMLVIIGVLVVAAADVSADPMPAGMSGFPIGPFLLASALGFSGSLSWTVQASDISRTLPARTSSHGVVWTVFTSMTLPLLVLGGIGAWISTDAGLDNPMGRVDSLLGGGAFAVIALLTMGTSLAVANAFNDFSAGLSLVQMGLRLPRPLASLCITACGVTLAIIARNTPLGELTSDIVLIAGYYTASWFGVVLVEMLFRRHQPQPWTIPARSSRRAVAAFLLGYLFLLPFSATPVGNEIAASTPLLAWIGWVSRNVLDGGGLGYPVGILAGAVLYLWWRRADAAADPFGAASGVGR